MALAAAATNALRATRRLQLAIERHGGEGLRRVAKAASELNAAVRQDVLCRETRISGPWGKLQSAVQLRRKCSYLNCKLKSLKRKHDHERGQHHNSIANYWIVHAGLSDTGLSLRSCADWCRDFQVGAPPLAAASLVSVRDDFCETL